MSHAQTPPASSPPSAARRVIDPIQRFMHTESSSGLVLGLAAVVALLWANLDASGYAQVWGTKISVGVGDHVFATTLQKLAKDGLMTVFFLVVGLEIKREITIGELADRRLAVVPLFAAVGGMALPAALYASLNAGGAGSHGWGIPMATDIAFALGVLMLLSRRVPNTLGALLLGVAVIDDIGAILVIALFYSGTPELLRLLGALLCTAGFWVMLRWRVRLVVPYAVLAVAAWGFMAGSGVSPTLIGVVLGLLVPVHPWNDPRDAARQAGRTAEELSGLGHSRGRSLAGWRALDDLGRQAVPLAERVEAVLHPWSAFVVLPVFALAWAGVPLSADALRDAADSPVAIGVVLGLVAGKLVGVTLGAWLAVRLGLGSLPSGVRWLHVTGVAALSGIGFTVSVFVASLAFSDQTLVDRARIGIVAGSLLAGLLGAGLLMLASRSASDGRAVPSPDR